MELSPGLHALHGTRSAEVIAVAVFAQPSTLAGERAGMLATRFRTVSLTIDSPRVRKKKPAAMTAFSSRSRSAHGEPNLRRIQSPRKRKSRSPRRRSPKKEEELFRVKSSKKMSRKKTEFQTACFPPLSFRR
jgi:hypothetical protein